MKKLIFAVILFPSMHCFSQTGKLGITKGQKITAVSSTSMDMDMGMGMQVKNVSSNTNTITVIGEDAKNYIVSNTLTKVNNSMSVMGQESTYDSEKPGDKDSEMGKAFSDKLNVLDTVQVDKMTGDITANKKSSPERPEKEDANPLAGMMSAFGGSAGADNLIVNEAFYLIPKGKKTGDSWMDSTVDKAIKTIKTYTLKSIDKNIATVLIDGTIKGNGTAEMQGTSVPFEMDTKNKGEITVNTTTGMVSKITNNSDISMTMEVMGQSMTATGKAVATVTYQ